MEQPIEPESPPRGLIRTEHSLAMVRTHRNGDPLLVYLSISLREWGFGSAGSGKVEFNIESTYVKEDFMN
jgi:hypothetical protein